MLKKRILVNASGLVVGGGIQVGISFIEETFKYKDFDFLFIVSENIYKNLLSPLQSDPRIICITISPSKLIEGENSRKKIIEIEKDFAPHLVYSLGFPSYIKFKSMEIGRYTNPWEINPPPLPWHTIEGIFNKLQVRLYIYFRQLWARKANFIETQTMLAKQGISSRLNYPSERIKVIPNSINAKFIKESSDIGEKDLFKIKENEIFCLAAPYEHKNLDLIPYVANCLIAHLEKPPTFILTLPDKSKIWKNINRKSVSLGVSSLIKNVGILNLDQCIDYYKRAKLVFLPTLLEIFSATYLEAMAMKVPIVTSDMDFAHDNCKEGAIYFHPQSFEDATRKILMLIENETLYNSQIINGLKVLKSYPNNKQKYDAIFEWFDEIIDLEC